VGEAAPHQAAGVGGELTAGSDKSRVIEKVALAIVDSVVAGGLSSKDLPFPPVAGYEIIFVLCAVLAALFGTVLSLRSNFNSGYVVAAIAVALVTSFTYANLIAGSGLSYWWSYLALFVYFGMFGGSAYAFASLVQELMRRLNA
jgi:hypothetical protein